MRLLHFDESGRLTWPEFNNNIPPYAILSHTWGVDEVRFEDLENGTGEGKAGYRKIVFCSEQAAHDHLQYFWVDTCCIDKRNPNELAKAINSMYRWYRNAAKCYALLSDVSISTSTDANLYESEWEEPFRRCKWFTRGWTLQELIAPASVEFFSLQHQRLGDKRSLEQQIYEITGIPIKALQGHPLQDFSVAERMAWARNRQTSEEEDGAYCLLGIFDVSMSLIYGEGKEKAIRRLRKVIDEDQYPQNWERQQQSSRSYLVPFKNPDFIGRSDIFGMIKSHLGPCLQGSDGPSQARVALHGLGGIGKTQIALAFVYWVLEQLPETLVFWVHASSTERFRFAYTEIARCCHIPGYDDPKADVLNLVKTWLERKIQRRWLLVLDNADDGDMFFSSYNKGTEGTNSPSPPTSNHRLIQFIPKCLHGAVLVTTRNKQAGLKLVGKRYVLSVGPLDYAELHQLMSRKLDSDFIHPEQTRVLARHLEHLPLALTQAAAFIYENSLTVDKYIQLLEKSDHRLVELLSQPFEDESRDSTVPNAVAATWVVSFKQIQEQQPLAFQLLSLMSFFDWQDIPRAFLTSYQENCAGFNMVEEQTEEQAATETIEIEKALGVIKAFSFVSEREAEDSFAMHRLTQLVLRKWLMMEAKAEKWQSEALLVLSSVFPYGQYEQWILCTRYLPHVFSVLSHAGAESKKDVMARAMLQHKVALFMLHQGKWNEAESHQLPATDARMKILGKDHPSTLSSMANLASTFWNQGRWKEAEELFVRVMETRKRVLGEEHPSTLTSMNNLAFTWKSYGRDTDALELIVKCLRLSRTILGDSHPNTLACGKTVGAWTAR